MTGGAVDLKSLVMSCLNESARNRPPVAQVSMTIKKIKEVYNRNSGSDIMSPIVWWAKVSSNQQSQVSYTKLMHYGNKLNLLLAIPGQVGIQLSCLCASIHTHAFVCVCVWSYIS